MVNQPASAPAAIETVTAWLRRNRRAIVGLSDRIARYAEPGLREYRSAEALCRFLERAGFLVRRGVACMPTAFVAEAGHGDPVVGLMCEYDGTPGDSQRATPFPNPISPGACGFPDLHNGIGAASAAAAAAAAASLREHGLSGTVRVFGTPAEKICVGKPYMARDGVFDGLDAVIAWHPRRYSSVEWDDGPGCYRAELLSFNGTGGYGAAPWTGVSALDGVTVMNVIVQFMREHIPRRFLASVNELVTSGGQHPTSLPSYAEAMYVYRSVSLEGVRFVEDLLGRAAEAASLATGAHHVRRVIAATRPWVPNHVLALHCYRGLERAGPPRFSLEMKRLGRAMLAHLALDPSGEPFDESLTSPDSGVTREFLGGADDVTEFCWHAPTARIYVAYGLRAPGLPTAAWPGAAFASTQVAHATIACAARAVAYSAVGLASSPDVLTAAREEFTARTGTAPIAPLLPFESEPPVDMSFGSHFPRGWRPPAG